MKPFRLLVAATAAAALCACQTYIPNLVVDPSFTYQTMSKAEMVIGGVSANLETMDKLGPKRSARYVQEMKKAIESERPELSVVDSARLRKKMRSAAYTVMLEEWDDGLSVSKKSLNAVKKAIPKAGYLTFARIEETSKSLSNSKSPFYQDKKQTGVSHNLAARREMKVAYKVYDLKSSVEVWNGVAPITKSATKYQLHKFGGSRGTYTLHYPKYPTVQEAFASASKGFAENLPNKE